VIGWLSAEHDIMPVTDWVDSTSIMPLEVAHVPIDSVRTDWTKAAIGREEGRADNERLGLLARLYKRIRRTVPFPVAPTNGGEFHLLDATQLTGRQACELIGEDQIPVTIYNIDGTDREAVYGALIRRTFAESKSYEGVAQEDFEAAVEQVSDPQVQQCFRQLRALSDDEYSPDNDGGRVIIPNDE